MKYAVTGRQMKEVDQDTIQRIGIPSVVLMERAALAVADAAERLARERPCGRGPQTRIVAVCGTGNNGADGIAAARILWGRGYDAAVVLAGDLQQGTEEYRLQRAIIEELGIRVIPAKEWDVQGGEIVLDALFGIGLGRAVEGEYRKLAEKMAGRPDVGVVAVDIPSGIHADTGAVMGTAVKALVTVTFGYVKSGLLLYPGKEYAGRVQVEDIGFFECSRMRAGWDALVLEKEDMAGLPKRAPDGNKGTFGKLLLVAGSAGMSGAAYLCALAAYRVGTGLVRILTVPENRAVLQAQLPEAIVDAVAPEEMALLAEGKCSWADAVVLGPGLGQEPYVERLVEAVLASARSPVVVDADALNAVAGNPRLEGYFADRAVVTPHMGEMARLTGQAVSVLKADRVRAAREYAVRTGAVCVLKDASTVTADRAGETYINASGCSAMAKGGSGDVLAGVVGGLLAQGMERTKAAAWGAYLHGLAGERAARKKGERAVLARELADSLGKD